MKRVVFLFLLLSCSLIGFGQIFEKGVLLKIDNVSLEGELYVEQSGNATVVYFKDNSNDKADIFNLKDIQSILFDNGLYFETKRTNEAEYSILAQCHIKSKVSLYTYYDIEGRKLYYLSTSDTSLLEPLIKENKIIRNAKTGDLEKIQFKKYIGVLNKSFIDCTEIVKKTGTYNFNIKGLKKLFIDYANCKEHKYEDYKQLKPSKIIGKIKYGGIFGYRYFKSTKQSFFYGGAFVDFYLNRTRNNYSIQPSAVVFFGEEIEEVPVLLQGLYVRHFNSSGLHVGLGVNAFPKYPKLIGISVVGGISKDIGPFDVFVQAQLLFNRFIFLNVGVRF